MQVAEVKRRGESQIMLYHLIKEAGYPIPAGVIVCHPTDVATVGNTTPATQSCDQRGIGQCNRWCGLGHVEWALMYLFKGEQGRGGRWPRVSIPWQLHATGNLALPQRQLPLP